MFIEKYDSIITGFIPHYSVKICAAYVLRHKKTGKVYVGSAINIYKRIINHKSDLLQQKHANKNMQTLFQESPYFEIGVYIVPDYYSEEEKREHAYNIEQYLLNYYAKQGNLINIATDARKNNLGRKHTDEVKARISALNTGRFPSEETRAKLRASMNDPVRKAKMIALNTGKIVSEETKEKLKIHSNRPEYIQYRKDLMKDKQRPISVNGIYYSGIKEAARQLGIGKQTLVGRLKSKNFDTYKYL